MKKAVKYSIIGGACALTGINAIRAAKFVPEKKEWGQLSDEKVDVEKACEHLSTAISIPTVSYPEKEKVDFTQFDKFHKFLEEAFPLIHQKLEKEVVEEASLIFRWKGKRDDLDPIALLAHQDVVRRDTFTLRDQFDQRHISGRRHIAQRLASVFPHCLFKCGNDFINWKGFRCRNPACHCYHKIIPANP
ncbi:MAG: hypothetical protein IJL77_06400 [Clostridia bacterium]|nr:hypothetical protein [Clostridia bacterium]